LDPDRNQLALVSRWLDANLRAQIQLAKAKLPHSWLLSDGPRREDAGSRLQQRHNPDRAFDEAGLSLGRAEELTKTADLFRSVGLGQADPRHGRSDHRLHVVGEQLGGSVDPDPQLGLAAIRLGGQPISHGTAGVGLGRGRHGVFEVGDNRVGTRCYGVPELAELVAWHKQVAACAHLIDAPRQL
jgi:hypothetical protein